MISRHLSFLQKVFHRKWSYLGISFLCFAFLFNVILPGREVHAAAEVISCNAGGNRTISVGTYTDSDGSQFSEGADLTLNVGTGSDCIFILNLTDTDPTVNLSSLTIESGVTLTHNVASSVESTYNRLAFNVSGDVTINSGASINVDGKGYLGGWQSDVGQQGRTEGNVAGSDFLSGGSHGGKGGSSSGASEYDSVSNPTLPGGGGSGAFGDNTRPGGNGGGVIRITATNIIVNGTLSAEGIPTAIAIGPYSGGAGGTVYLHASAGISGNGTISAASGDDPSLFTDGGKGGGGRIALHYADLTFSGTLTAHGGKSSATVSYSGAAGTIYKKPAAQAYGDLILDNNNNPFDNGFSKPTTLSSSISDSDQVAMFGGAYVFNSITVQNYAVLNISSSLDSHSDGTSDSARKLYALSCTADNDDLSDGEIQYNTAQGSGVNADYTCVSPEYVMGFSSTSDTDLESVSAGSFNIVGAGPVSSEVTFDYAIKVASTTASGAGVDYTLLNGTGTILVGDSSTTIPFTIVNDTEQETDEIFVVEISNPSVGAVLGANTLFTYTIIDEDTPGITFATGGSVDVNEGFGNDTYTVVLDSPPSSDVTISLTGDADVDVSPSTLTFTSENWFTPQTITVTAVDDHYFESSHSGTISYAVSSADVNYNNFLTSSTTVSISDNDSVNITIDAPGDDIVSENGVTDTYTIILTSIPSADVTISVSPDADTSVSPVSLVFTPDNWNVPQTVTVSAVDDGDVESSEFSTISHSAASTDMNFMGASLNSASFTVIDNETANVTITQSGGATSVREGSSPDTYTINLEKEPTSDVIITASTFSSDISLSPEILTFTSVNWLSPQTITITAVDDETFEGSDFVSISHAISSDDTDYNSLFLNGLNFNVLDNDGFTVTESGGTTNVTEGGATDSYTIVLNENPFSNVTLALSTSTQYTLSTSTVVFTSSNWDTPQTVTVTAVDDESIENDHTATITGTITTFAFKYSNTALPSVTVLITDNDAPTPGVTITESSGTTALTEAGTTDSYTVVLDTEPTANVVVTVTPDADSTVTSSPLTFTPLNWDTPVTVTVTAVNNNVAEGTHTSTITHTASSIDVGYDNIAIASVTSTITDNDTAGVTIAETGASTAVTEGGTTDEITVVLTSAPTSTVTVSLTPNSQITLSTSSIEFSAANWNVPVTSTISAVNDSSVEGNHTGSILYAVASSNWNYNGITVASTSVTITDNDVAATDTPSNSNSVSAPAPAPVLSSPTGPTNVSTPAAPPVAVNLDANKPVFVSVGGESHTITQVGAATANQITIIIRSEPITVTLLKNSPQEVDTDKDGTADVKLLYKGLSGGQPQMEVTALTEAGESMKPVSISSGAETTSVRDVKITLRAQNVDLIAVSEDPTFAGGSFIAYAPTVNWTLSPGVGVKTVYVRFRSPQGGTVDASDSIVLQAANTKTCSLTVGKVYKYKNAPGIYYIVGPRDLVPEAGNVPCTKRPFKNPRTYFSYFTSYSEAKVVESKTLDAIPNDPLKFMAFGPLEKLQENAVVKQIVNSRVYILKGNKLHWIQNEQVFNAMGLKWNAIQDISSGLFDKFIEGTPISSATDPLVR